MRIRDLFVVTTQEAEKGKPIAASSRGDAVGVFVTPKSLLAFPTASFVVTLLATFMRKIFPVVAGSIWVSVGSAFFIGLVIFITTISSPSFRLRGWKQWFVAVAVALVNCVYLAATALGLLTVPSAP